MPAENSRTIPKPTQFGKNLKLLRKLAGLSQLKLAQKLGISRGKIASYEASTAEPSGESFLQFCVFFEVDPAQMLGSDLAKVDLDLVKEDSEALRIALTDLLAETTAVESKLEKLRKLNTVNAPNRLQQAAILELLDATLEENWKFLRNIVQVVD